MSKRWSCDTLGEGFQHVMTEAAHDEQSRILKEIEDPSQLRWNRIEHDYTSKFQKASLSHQCQIPFVGDGGRTGPDRSPRSSFPKWHLASSLSPR